MAEGKQAAAAAERKGKKKLTIKGQTFNLPAKPPFVLTRYVSNSVIDMNMVIEVLLKDQAEKFWDLELDMDEGRSAVEDMVDLYGLTEGE